MSAVSETIVREYFELHGFFVRQQRKFAAPSRREDDEIDFLVVHPTHSPGASLPFELRSADLNGVARAVVVVKGWHTDTFSPGLLANAPEIEVRQLDSVDAARVHQLLELRNRRRIDVDAGDLGVRRRR